MPRSTSREHAGRRRSIFSIPSFTQIHPTTRDDPDKLNKDSSKTLKKRRGPTLITNLESSPELVHDEDPSPSSANTLPSPKPTGRPTLSVRSGGRPVSSVFGSLRSMRSMHEDDGPLTATSSRTPSINWADFDNSHFGKRLVLHHGEVQTSSSMFRKKKEYLVLTDTHILRYKNQSKAADSIGGVPPPFGRSPTIRHSSTQSIGSSQDLQSLHSDSSGDKEGRVTLRHIVAVHRLDDGRPYFAIEVCYLDEEGSQASAMVMQFGDPEDRDLWLRSIRTAANKARLQDVNPFSVVNSKNAARAVERENDYDPANYVIYKVVQRQFSKSRSSTDDLSKIASTVCFLAIGIHKIHVIPLIKTTSRVSSPSLSASNVPTSYGILNMTAIRLSHSDDHFELTFRQPMKRPKTLYLASLASQDIALRLHHVENVLRPECSSRLFKFNVPQEIEDHLPPSVNSDAEDHCCFERTLTAYCIAYDVNPSNICYTIDYTCEDAPRFQLLPFADARRQKHSAAELLAVMRALRYNESFNSLSFADVQLDVLNGLHDNYGSEHVCTRTKRGTPLRLTAQELTESCLLIQEVRALAATNKKLRRMDFSRCIVAKPPDYTDDSEVKIKDIGCGVVEALSPLCKHQITNVDWIALNGIHLSETDLDYLVGAASDKACHFRAIELSRCSLTDRTLSLILDSLRAQDNTLEALDISGNLARLAPAVFDGQISVFGFIRKLNLSFASRTSGAEPLFNAETLLTWRLEELRLTGTSLNENTIQALATYLKHQQSDTLRELYLDSAYMSGSDIATIMRATKRGSIEPRSLHLDISHNNITKDHDQLCKAIADGSTPTHITIRAIEYREESVFRHLINALRKNHSIRYLDISRTTLPSDANDDTSRALESLFAENSTLEELDISGEDSRLETSRFGVGLNQALNGLRHNTGLHVLRVQYQRLGLPGASMLAEVLKVNRTLRELHCEHNDIPLSAFTDMINALGKNTTLVYMPYLDESRLAALKHTETQVKHIRDEVPATTAPLRPSISAPPAKPLPSSSSSSTFRKGLANMKRTVNRSSSAAAPSFPSLAPSPRHTSSPLSSSRPFSPSKTKVNNLSNSPITAPIPSLTDQDIQAALRLVTESWDRQQYRLQQYLERNCCILHGVPTSMEIEEEAFERTTNVGTLSQLIEKVKLDSTPTAEKELDFGNGYGLPEPNVVEEEDDMQQREGLRLSLPPRLQLRHDVEEDEQPSVSFKQFLLGHHEMSSPEDMVDGVSSSSAATEGEDSELPSPVLEMGGPGVKGLAGLGINQGDLKTPTQKSFFG
ncbi:leucine rich repeat protein [Aureobasidium pullulans]|uniref:Leucine rich repeat protein n=1 Tax=Aureobasidium pullulans TaxID=5580 RepID=A0A4S9CWD7_AURPU|nr:leucine rich repeat protein [Aureobasidium pullulans]